jgi:hypothetical protein
LHSWIVITSKAEITRIKRNSWKEKDF